MFEQIIAKLAELEKTAAEIEQLAQHMPLSASMRDLMEMRYGRVKIETRSLRVQVLAKQEVAL